MHQYGDDGTYNDGGVAGKASSFAGEVGVDGTLDDLGHGAGQQRLEDADHEDEAADEHHEGDDEHDEPYYLLLQARPVENVGTCGRTTEHQR